MSDLSSKKCIPCEGNIPPFDKSEIHNYLKFFEIVLLNNQTLIYGAGNGFEPTTSSLATRRSTTELCPQSFFD